MQAIINIETLTKAQILELAKEDSSLMKMLGGENAIESREVSSLKTLVKMHFALNNEVGAFFGKNGF